MQPDVQASYGAHIAAAHRQIAAQVRALWPTGQCVACGLVHPCPADDKALLKPGPVRKNCLLGHWQQAMAHWLEANWGRHWHAVLAEIAIDRDRQQCHQCGACCSFASNEADYQTLVAMAEAGDVFAQEFVQVFIPYESEAEAVARHPAIAAQLAQENDSPVQFYRCAYLGANNACTLFGDARRPSMCATYPAQPLVFVQQRCGWAGWKAAHHEGALAAHAAITVGLHVLEQLQPVHVADSQAVY